jgi:hypothetical protein
MMSMDVLKGMIFGILNRNLQSPISEPELKDGRLFIHYTGKGQPQRYEILIKEVWDEQSGPFGK